MRDIGQLYEAEKCAFQAIEYQRNSHQPYTLMGAICYDRFEYSEGNDWFEKAIERGADTGGIDDEIKRVVRNEKDKKKQR